MKVLVTGGAGYIGSHTVVSLIDNGHVPIVVDDLSNSSSESINRVEKITGQKIEFHKFNICDNSQLKQFFANKEFDAVIHFAGFKAVGESIDNPLKYYENNLDSTLSILKVMNELERPTKPKIIFSSSATVYGSTTDLPLTEDSQVGIGITNPYGFTKYVSEQILSDVAISDPQFQAIALRYFNPIGAHPSGLIGDDPLGIPNNIAPYITQVAAGKLSEVSVFGDDYETSDGTGVRDYIHIMDVAEGHVAALNFEPVGFHAFNLGTGEGTSVLELISSFEEASEKKIPYRITNRRPGDIAACFADTSKAEKDLSWKATRTVAQACIDSWRWQSKNPQGYLSISASP